MHWHAACSLTHPGGPPSSAPCLPAAQCPPWILTARSPVPRWPPLGVLRTHRVAIRIRRLCIRIRVAAEHRRAGAAARHRHQRAAGGAGAGRVAARPRLPAITTGCTPTDDGSANACVTHASSSIHLAPPAGRAVPGDGQLLVLRVLLSCMVACRGQSMTPCMIDAAACGCGNSRDNQPRGRGCTCSSRRLT